MCNFSEAILEQGIEQGIERGKELGKLQLLCMLVEDGKLSVKEAAENMGISEKDFLEKMSEQ